MSKSSNRTKESILMYVKPEDRERVLTKLNELEELSLKRGSYIPWGLALIPVSILIFLGFCIYIGYKAAGVI